MVYALKFMVNLLRVYIFKHKIFISRQIKKLSTSKKFVTLYHELTNNL